MADPKPSPDVEPEIQDDPVEDMHNDAEMAQDPISALEVEIDELIAQRDEMRDRMIRALADAENSRKRAEKDRRDAQLYGGSKIARDMLPVYDNLTRALNAANEDTRAAAPGLVEGVELTSRVMLYP